MFCCIATNASVKLADTIAGVWLDELLGALDPKDRADDYAKINLRLGLRGASEIREVMTTTAISLRRMCWFTVLTFR